MNPATTGLSNDEILRYSRHLIMPELGLEGQKKLKAARVLCIGAGGLGSPTALYLGAAGIGTLGIVDFDVVDQTNLQRQVIHGTADVGRRKVESAAERIRANNPFVAVETFDTTLTKENALGLFRDFDLIVDGTDNFATRYLANDAAVLCGKPYVYASVFRFEGQASVFGAKHGPCYRCLYPEPPPPGMVPSCAEGGVLGVLPGLLGIIQATETIKLILGLGDSLVGRLLLVDALGMRFRELRIQKDPACPLCGESPRLHELGDYEALCGIRGEEVSTESSLPEVAPRDLKRELDEGRDLVILDVREPHEREICALPGLFIPLGTLADRVHELDTASEIVVYCKSGYRSAKAVGFLRSIGYRKVRSLAGGITGWAEQIDQDMPRY